MRINRFIYLDKYNVAIKSLLTLLCGILLLLPLASQASLGARPAYLFVDLNKRNPSGTFTISNLGDTKQTYRARAIHFELKEDGSIFPVKPDDYSLAEWIKFNPKEFTLPPHTSRLVRFTIVASTHKLKPREYWGAIEFTPLTGASFTNTDKQGRKMEFKVITALLIPIYGEMPGIVYDGSIKDVSAEQDGSHLKLSAMIANTGQGGLRISGNWKIFDKESGKLVKTVKTGKSLILPQQRRHLVTKTDEVIPAGQYTVILTLQYSDGKTMSAQNDVSLQ